MDDSTWRSWITDIDIDLSIERPLEHIFSDIIAEARENYNANAMGFHLVAAKLALVLPNVHVEARRRNGDSGQLGGLDRFEVADTVIYFSLEPSILVVEQCSDSVSTGKRVILIVRSRMLEAARQLLWLRGVAHQVGVYPLESYLSQTIEMQARFSSDQIRAVFTKFIEEYNKSVLAAGYDGAPCIELPPEYRQAT